MQSQWHCLLKNLGVWQGSFARFSPTGEWREETPTIVSLEGLNDDQTVRQIIQRYTPMVEAGSRPPLQADVPIDEKVLEYSSLGRGVLFFKDGAFSQGSMQFAPFSEFGAELGLIAGDRRLRLVQLFDRESQLSQLTLIREQRAGSDAAERAPLTLEALMGEWHGEAITLYPDWRSPTTYSTHLQISRSGDNQVVQALTFGNGAGSTIRSTANVAGSRLQFNQGALPVQVLLLPDGASATSPLQIQTQQPFFLEVGWLLQPHQRQRLIRSYDSKGAWVSLTLVNEQKVTTGNHSHTN
ncbi:DUF3598 family protein [Leptolyngbya sp. FACHB-321]|uniref:DUF3598 family protein n=1 Tax=Leptolyngbya sp. FACHB-321 TaxID=2692807 RepID=UPI0016841E2A|nr:DUF3598 family protein [Leptolyngbya sp. FACHB-321]MBD2034973.1 DUF3598 family protein [Leptolyngbya sp. FACHB-321]